MTSLEMWLFGGTLYAISAVMVSISYYANGKTLWRMESLPLVVCLSPLVAAINIAVVVCAVIGTVAYMLFVITWSVLESIYMDFVHKLR